MRQLVIGVVAVLLIAVAAVLFWPAAGGPTKIEYGAVSCARCDMLLGRPGFAGELEKKGGGLAIYDDLGCLLLDFWASPGQFVAGWVEDHKTHELVPLGEAIWVAGEGIETPMNHGIVAFRAPADAQALAAEKSARVLKLAELVAMKADLEARGAAASAAHAPGARPLTSLDATRGKDSFIRECAGCHGERGDGKGPAAEWVEPKPRDFTKRQFKLRTTPSGTPPTTADILRTIERGIPGTSMPSFAFLPEAERRNIGAYVLQLAGMLSEPEPAPVEQPAAPPATDASRARGKEVYAAMFCHSCHGPLGKGDGPSAKLQKDTEGRPVAPRDFSTGVFRGGHAREDLFFRFTTGMDGSPMPAFADNINMEDRWALVDYVLSLEQPAPPVVYPKDALAAGRRLAQKYSCRGCHVLDDGKGGDVGPDLRISGQKLSSDWVKKFLASPRDVGKIYMWRKQRMPHLGLSAEEVEVGARYLAAMGKRTTFTTADPSSFPAESLATGKGIFMLRCTECHTLGKVIETPLMKQQGPDLINASERVDFAWAKRWIADPKKIDPKTRMTNPGITEADAEAVRMFVWKTSLESRAGAVQ